MTGVPADGRCDAALVAALEAVLAEGGGAVVVLDRDGGVAHMSANAEDLLAAYCPPEPDGLSSLPQSVRAWLGNGVERPLEVSGPRGRLHVRVIGGAGIEPWRALLVRERRGRPPSVESMRALGLTAREADVLRLLVGGRRDRDIARELSISVPTVRKHLEHVYRKLGVATRAQAVARALG